MDTMPWRQFRLLQMNLIKLLLTELTLVGLTMSYNRVLLTEWFTCTAGSSATFINITEKLQATLNPSISPSLTDFTIVFWAKISHDYASEFDLFTLISPTDNYTMRISASLSTTTSTYSYGLRVNGSLVMDPWLAKSDKLTYGENTTSLRGNPSSFWEVIVLSVGMSSNVYTINTINATANGSLFSNFSIPLNKLYIIMGGSQPVSALCRADFLLHDMYIYDQYFFLPANISDIKFGAPGKLFAVFKPQFSNQYDYTWYNLLARSYNYQAHGQVIKHSQTLQNYNEFRHNGQRVNRQVYVFYTGVVRNSPVDQSYIYSISYGVGIVWPLGAQGFSLNMYQRTANDSFIGVTGLVTIIDTVNYINSTSAFAYVNTYIQGSPAYAQMTNSFLNQTTNPIPYNNSLIFAVNSHILNAQNSAILHFPKLGISQSSVINAPFRDTDLHSFSRNTTNSYFNFRGFIWDVMISHGSTFVMNQVNGTYVSLASNPPVLFDCADNANPLRATADNNEVVIPNECQKQQDFGFNCPSFPYCSYCGVGDCKNCYPGYVLINSNCYDCKFVAGINAVWDPVTHACLPGLGTISLTGNTTKELNDVIAAFPKFHVFRMQLSCNNVSPFCVNRSEIQTVYFHQVFQSGLKMDTYSLNITNFTISEWPFLLSFATRIWSTSNVTYYAQVDTKTYRNFLGSLVKPNFDCSFFGKVNFYIYPNFESCGDCKSPSVILRNGRCVKLPAGCVDWNFELNCYLCAQNYTLVNGQCQLLTNDPKTLALLTPPVVSMGVNSSGTNLTTNETTVTLITMNISIAFLTGKVVTVIPVAPPPPINCSLIDPNCLECVPGICQKCIVGYRLLLNSCFVQECADKNCIHCPNYRICQICAFGYDLTAMKDCEGTAETSNALVAMEVVRSMQIGPPSIVSCPPNCSICSSEGKCSACLNGYLLMTYQNACRPINKVNTASFKTNISKTGTATVVQPNNCLLDGGTCTEVASSNVIVPTTNRCSYCVTCQHQTTFYCQQCSICRSVCRCTQRRATLQTGLIINCPNVVFYPEFIKNISIVERSYDLYVDSDNPGTLSLQVANNHIGNITMLITPMFIKSSFNCTFSKPISIFYQQPSIIFSLNPKTRGKVTQSVYLTRTGILFTVQFLGNSLGQFLIAVIELNVFFTFLGLLKLQIPGFYDAALTLSTDSEASRTDMNLFFSERQTEIYYALNIKYNGYFLMNQTVLLLNAIVIAIYGVVWALTSFAKSAIPHTSMIGITVLKYMIVCERVFHSGFEMINNANLIGLTSGVYYFGSVLLVEDNLWQSFTFAVCVYTCILPTLWSKLTEFYEVFRQRHLVEERRPNDLRIVNIKIWYLRLHNMIEEICLVCYLALFFAFQLQKVNVLYFTLGYCVSQVQLSLIFIKYHYRHICVMKIAQFLMMYCFASLCLTMAKGLYTPVSLGFNVLFLSCHISKILNYALAVNEQYKDGLKYDKLIKRIKREYEAAYVIQRMNVRQNIRRTVYQIQKETKKKRFMSKRSSNLVSYLQSFLKKQGPMEVE